VLVQQKVDRTRFINFFNRSWAEYKVGFNDSNGNFWIGNDLLHQLTTSGRYKLRFDVQERNNGSWYYAEYSRFIVESEASNYRMHVSGHSGNAGASGFSYQDVPYDRDNDQLSSNCAVTWGGGFWFKDCFRTCVNCGRGFFWNGYVRLQASRMWLC